MVARRIHDSTIIDRPSMFVRLFKLFQNIPGGSRIENVSTAVEQQTEILKILDSSAPNYGSVESVRAAAVPKRSTCER